MELFNGRRASINAGAIISLLVLGTPALATINVYSNGQDGALNITTNTVIDLSSPTVVTDAAWDAATPGIGAYDATRWAIVFHYTSVTIASGMTLTFINHPKNAPVVWLVAGSVNIAGTVHLNGQDGLANAEEALGGPGGFRGGRGQSLSLGGRGEGFGPGGGRVHFGGSFGVPGNPGSGPVYGTPELVPLVGGSGGGGRDGAGNTGGGGGGGAILIAAANSVVLGGSILANGGYSNNGGGGSGGGIRIVADQFSGGISGALRTQGGNGYYAGWGGRICINANTIAFQGSSDPAYAAPALSNPPQIWPASTAPSVRVIELAGVALPSDPLSSLTYPLQDVLINPAGDVSVRLESHNIPQASIVSVFVTKSRGSRIDPPIVATWQSGSPTLGYWIASVPASSLTNGSFAIQARAVLP